MSETIQSNKKDIYVNSINNYSSDPIKIPIPISNINTNIHSNSCSQENIFNELITSANCQESKNNSSFYNFSESIHSNPENPNIIMNKDQLYQTFILFQKFLNQNIANNNINPNNISSNKIEAQSKSKKNYKINEKNKNAINEIYEINENEDNIYENEEINDKSNGKIILRKNKTSQNWKNCEIKLEASEINKELIESKSHYNIINGKDILNNGGNDNIIFFDEEQKKDNDKEKDLIYKKEDENIILKLNNNTNFQKRNNSDDIRNSETKNSYDDIPIKYNKVNFIDLVEKKLADEKKIENMSLNNLEQSNIFSNKKKIEKNENENNIQIENNIIYSKKIKNKIKNDNNIDKEKKIEKSEREKEKIILDNNNINKKNNISNNYSFDREETKILNENKNIFENSSIIDNFNNILTRSDKKQIINNNANTNVNNENIIISKENINKLLINNLISNKVNNYKIDKIQLCLINKKEKKKEEFIDININKIDEKEQLLNQKIKELNKEIVKFKEERNKVSKIKIEYEKSMSKLNNDLYQFSQKRNEFEKYRKNELAKIKNDKKNIISESKNIKDIKNQNQTLILKAKKDKELIDNLKTKINELQSIIKQKENINSNLIGNCNTNTVKYSKKRSGTSKTNNLPELEIDINQNQLIDGYFGNIKNNSIRSMTNIKNIYCNTIEDKNSNKISNNDIEKEKELQNMSLTMKRNSSSNKKKLIISKQVGVAKNENKSKNDNSLTVSNYGSYMNETKNMKNNINNDSKERISISKKILEKTQKNFIGSKDILNDRIIFSPQASRTSVGFGLKKLSIKLNNTPKDNVKITKKIYENKNKQNKKNYSKTTNNNLAGSINSNINNESNQNSYSYSHLNINNNNKQNINKKNIAKDKLIKRQNFSNDLFNSYKISKKNIQRAKKNEKKDIFSSKSKNYILNKASKAKNENDYVNNNLNNSANNIKKMRTFNNKLISKDNISRNSYIKSNEKINITDNNIINIKNYLSLSSKNNNKISDEFNFTIPKKYLNIDYKLIKSLKTDDKIINLYTNDKKEIIFKSGVKKEIYKDGHQIIFFANGDLKQIYPDGKSSYFFQESKTVQITLKNGMEIYKFENGQVEKHYPDGTKQILFNDGSERYIYNDGYEETYFSDGYVQKIDKKRNVIEEKLQDDEDE